MGQFAYENRCTPVTPACAYCYRRILPTRRQVASMASANLFLPMGDTNPNWKSSVLYEDHSLLTFPRLW